MKANKSNMYADSKYQWNVYVGCLFQCKYCIPSFQRQMKRQKQRCQECYEYHPHFHPERLNNKLPRTYGDEFIWVGSSGDISFAKKKWMDQILEKIQEYPNRTFFFQTKNPAFFHNYSFLDNVLLGITLETDRSYPSLTKAPEPYKRYKVFLEVDHPRKIITIEPILDFNGDLLDWIRKIYPERVYLGYDTKKCGLPEPPHWKVVSLINELKKFTVVKLKYMKDVEVP